MPDDYHEKDGKIEAFGWGNLDAIIDFILSAEKSGGN